MPSPTPQQQAAIDAEGDVLVMAGAGTGKTSTLVARVADRLTRAGNRVPADRLLMVTFTEAAAQEMRSRLRRELEDRVAASGGDEALRLQATRLELAQIGTLHAFCLRLLREHGAVLGLDPRFTLLDEVEAWQLADRTLDTLLDGLLSGDDAPAREVQSMARGQFGGDLRALRGAVTGLHRHARTLVDPAGWLAREAARWASPEPDAWRGALADFLPGWAAQWHTRLAAVRDNPNASRRADALGGWLRSGADPAGFAPLLDLLAEAPDEKWPPRRKGVCREPLKALFDDAAFLCSLRWADPGPDPLAEDWQCCRGAMASLVGLASAFAEAFAREKRSRGLLDFQDLEQFALDLLVRGDGAVAAACRGRFDLVVVDECQDINAAQDAVLRAVCRDGAAANRFLVGDVKQSIYRFRLADPRVFQRQADEWSGPDASGRVLPLTGNFRSAEGILRFVNRVFPRLMRRGLGGVEYGPDAALEFGDPAGRAALACANDPAPRVEVHVVAAGDDSEEGDDAAGDVETGAAEARVVAARFRALRDAGLPVWDRGTASMRPVRWSDMAVLLRAEKDRAAEYAAEFAAAGIPLQARQLGFFLQPEVADLVSVLRCLDNPLQDVPLVSVLRSPLVGLDDLNGLAAVRMHRRGERQWWTLVRAFVEAGRRLGLRRGDAASGPAPGDATPLEDADGNPVLSGDAVFTHPATARHASQAWHRLDRLMAWYPDWRLRAERRGVASVLEAVLDDTGCEARLEGMADGAAPLANVRRLLDLAREFDRGQRGGLYRFLRWLDAQERADRIEASTGAGGDAVRLMTVHRSKGLEFPVVAVGGLGRRFNLSDLKDAVVCDEQHGLCPLVVAPDGRRYPSAGLWLAQRRQRRETLGEELRLLYVAFTRAVDHLLLVGTPTRKAVGERWPALAAECGAGPLPDGAAVDAGCALDWLGPLFAADAAPQWGTADAGVADTFSWRFWRALPGILPPAASVPDAAPAAPGPAAPSYAFAAATAEPAKVTVTGLRKRIAAAAAEESAGYARWTGRTSSEADDVSAVEAGVLHHRFLEHVDPARAADAAGVAAEVARLASEGRFTEAEAAALDVPALARFMASELGARLRAAGAALQREFPFTLRLDASDLRALGLASASDLPDGEFVVAQGVVDVVVPDGDGVWILDYKTDRVAPGAEKAKAEGYRPQLRVYALAVERILGKKVHGCWLHFLRTGASEAV